MSLASLNYFELFSLPKSFQVAGNDLERAYKKLQAQHHPDRFTDADDSERLRALQHTSLINDAYETLKSPLKRAAYLLKLSDIDPEEHNQAHLHGDFLLRQMETREALEGLLVKEDIEGLDRMKGAVNLEKDETLGQFVSAYTAGELVDAKSIYNKLQFLFKLADEIESAEEKLLDY